MHFLVLLAIASFSWALELIIMMKSIVLLFQLATLDNAVNTFYLNNFSRQTLWIFTYYVRHHTSWTSTCIEYSKAKAFLALFTYLIKTFFLLLIKLLLTVFRRFVFMLSYWRFELFSLWIFETFKHFYLGLLEFLISFFIDSII